MRVVKEGDKGKAVCEFCGLSTTTYALRDVDFSDKRGTVKNIIVGVCDKCGGVASIPSQSVPQIKSEYNKTLKPLETRVPAHFIDILNLAIKKIDKDLDEKFSKTLFLYYLHNFSTGKFSDKNVSKLLESEISKAKLSKRFSIKISKKTEREIDVFITHSGLKSKSDLVKVIILTINNDIVQAPLPKHLSELKKLAAVYQ
jgi:hypothetical protein